MSTPDSTHSKGRRPSLLSETAPGAADNSSRILANLEGRVLAQQPVRGRSSKKSWVAAALAVVALATVAALGACQWQRIEPGEHPIVAAGADQPHGAVTMTVSAASAASAASGSLAHRSPGEHSGQRDESPVPQAAVIVADDPMHANPAAAGDRVDPLSRALASGVTPAQAADNVSSSTTVAAAASAASGAKPSPAAKAVASRTEHERAQRRRAEKVAGAHAGKHAKGRVPAAKDDPDADLLAVLVARTKPYHADAPKGASATTAGKAKQPSVQARTASLSDQMKVCDKGNLFEAQACRWRVCSGHWGKDPVCPSPASSNASADRTQ